MAATLTPDGELTYFSFPIEKSSETAEVNPVDGTPDLVVYGKATDGTLDSDLQIVDPEWSAKAIQDWLATGGNLRVQHQARRDPAGVGLDVTITPDGHYVKALVTEPVAKHLVRTKALQDFSVGVTLPDIRTDPTGKAMNGIITGRRDGLSKISEISLVDRGSNFNSKFQLVKAASDGAPEFVGKMFTTIDVEVNGSILSEDELAATVQQVTKKFGKRYEDDSHTHLTIPDDVHVAFTPADLAKMLGRNGVAKRKMDPDVGGGVDRDKIPAADFAGKDRSFPIVTPGDVSDAASSIGRAGDGNYSADQLKKNIIRIARRKGASFVAELPATWKKELGMSESTKDADVEVEKTTEDVDVEKADKPFEGAAPKFGDKKDDKDDDAKDDKADKAAASADGDKPDPDDQVNDEGGDDEVDDTKKSIITHVDKVVAVEKKSKVMCTTCGANVHDKHKFCSECGGSLKGAPSIKKNHDFTCLDCGHQLDKGEKFCPDCGTKNPGYLPFADNKAKVTKAAGDDGSAGKVAAAGDENDTLTAKKARKAKKKAEKAVAVDAAKGATPTAVAEEAASAKPVPEHREPDGPAIEEFEKDSGLTDGDEATKTVDLFFPDDPEASASMRLKMLNVPLDYGMLHDLTCPCYHPDDVAKSYPQFDLSTVDAVHWQQKAFDMAASAPLDQARKATELWQHIITLKGTDPRDLMEVRSGLYKEFRDANPGPGSFPTPGAISPRSFNHPLLTAGHEAASPGHDGPNTAPGSFAQISAGGYNRGYLDAGHAAESPSDMRQQIQPVSTPSTTGVPTRTYYTTAMRNNARQAMSAMHDHIASTFPDLCPAYTTAGPYQSENLPGSRPVAPGVGGPVPHGAAKVKKSKKKDKKHVVGIEDPKVVTPEVDKGATITMPPAGIPAPVEKAAVLDMDAVQAMITKAVTDVRAESDAEITSLRKDLKKARKQLNVIAEQPEPGGPYRGVAFDSISKATAAPDVLPSVARVERAQQAFYNALYHQWRNDPDPMQREVAWRELNKMSGINNNPVLK